MVPWCPTSPELLAQYEEKVFRICKKAYKFEDVNVGQIAGINDCKIHTIIVQADCAAEEKGTPIVLIHGFGVGMGIFGPNVEELSKNRDLYAIDLPGFGLSSRPRLSGDAMGAEQQVVQAIEEWRSKMELDKFILLGHSLGGFVSSAYALSYPQHIKHLILEDPWGFDEYDSSKKQIMEVAMVNSLKHINAFVALRAAGPAGPALMRSICGRSHGHFKTMYPHETDTMALYLYHCNVQDASGEEFFRTISIRFGYTKYPMGSRLGKLDKNIGITFIFAGKTFIPREPGLAIREERKESFVQIVDVPESGHEIHTLYPKQFNKIVNEVCDKLDNKYVEEDAGDKQETTLDCTAAGSVATFVNNVPEQSPDQEAGSSTSQSSDQTTDQN